MHAQQTDWHQGLQTGPTPLNRESPFGSGVRSYGVGNSTDIPEVRQSPLSWSSSFPLPFLLVNISLQNLKCVEPDELVRLNPVLLEGLFFALALPENQSCAKM